jgi:hypothetical protein
VVSVCEHLWNLGKVTFQCAKILKAVRPILLTFVRPEPPSVTGSEISDYLGQLRISTRVLISPKPDLLPDVFCLLVRIFRLMLVFLCI